MTSTRPPVGLSGPFNAEPVESRCGVFASSLTVAVKSHLSPLCRIFGSVSTTPRYVLDTIQTDCDADEPRIKSFPGNSNCKLKLPRASSSVTLNGISKKPLSSVKLIPFLPSADHVQLTGSFLIGLNALSTSFA